MQFFLSALVALGIVTVALAQPPDKTPTADEQKAMDLVRAAGGKTEIDPRLAPGARVVAKFETATDATLINLKKAPQIGAVEVFDATKCTEKGFGALKDLPNLRGLNLSQSQMTPTRLTAINQCKELRVLYLGGSGLSDAGLVTLKKLALLEELDVSDNPRITDAGMASIKELVRLRSLNLGKTGISDKGLMELKPLDGLRTLLVVGTKVTGDGAEKFADEMPNLRAVRR